MSTTTPLSTSGSWFVCLFVFFFFFFLVQRKKLQKKPFWLWVLPMFVCFFFFSFFFPGSGGFDKCGCGWVVVVGIAMMVEVMIDIDGGGFDECGYGWICD